MSYKFNVFEFLSFIIPGLLLVLPVLFMPSILDAIGPGFTVKSADGNVTIISQPLVTAAVVLVVSYVLGLLIYYVGRVLEQRILERGEAPSRRVLIGATTAALTSPVPDRIRSVAREHFELPDTAGDSQLFSLMFRHLFMIGKAERVARFLHLRNLTRGATVVFFAWFVITVGAAISAGPTSRVIASGIAFAAIAVLTDRVRRAYNRDIAEEVYVAYYVHSCTQRDRGRHAEPTRDVTT